MMLGGDGGGSTTKQSVNAKPAASETINSAGLTVATYVKPNPSESTGPTKVFSEVFDHYYVMSQSNFFRFTIATGLILSIITLILLFWKYHIRARTYGFRKHTQALVLQNTQIPYKMNMIGIILYYAWSSYMGFIITGVALVMLLQACLENKIPFVDLENELLSEGSVQLFLARMLLNCRDVDPKKFPSPYDWEAATTYHFRCAHWRLAGDDRLPFQVQMPMLFFSLWVILFLIVGTAFYNPIYWMLVLLEVDEISEADIIGFSEDIYESETLKYPNATLLTTNVDHLSTSAKNRSSQINAPGTVPMTSRGAIGASSPMIEDKKGKFQTQNNKDRITGTSLTFGNRDRQTRNRNQSLTFTDSHNNTDTNNRQVIGTGGATDGAQNRQNLGLSSPRVASDSSLNSNVNTQASFYGAVATAFFPGNSEDSASSFAFGKKKKSHLNHSSDNSISSSLKHQPAPISYIKVQRSKNQSQRYTTVNLINDENGQTVRDTSVRRQSFRIANNVSGVAPNQRSINGNTSGIHRQINAQTVARNTRIMRNTNGNLNSRRTMSNQSGNSYSGDTGGGGSINRTRYATQTNAIQDANSESGIGNTSEIVSGVVTNAGVNNLSVNFDNDNQNGINNGSHSGIISVSDMNYNDLANLNSDNQNQPSIQSGIVDDRNDNESHNSGLQGTTDQISAVGPAANNSDISSKNSDQKSSPNDTGGGSGETGAKPATSAQNVLNDINNMMNSINELNNDEDLDSPEDVDIDIDDDVNIVNLGPKKALTDLTTNTHTVTAIGGRNTKITRHSDAMSNASASHRSRGYNQAAALGSDYNLVFTHRCLRYSYDVTKERFQPVKTALVNMSPDEIRAEYFTLDLVGHAALVRQLNRNAAPALAEANEAASSSSTLAQVTRSKNLLTRSPGHPLIGDDTASSSSADADENDILNNSANFDTSSAGASSGTENDYDTPRGGSGPLSRKRMHHYHMTEEGKAAANENVGFGTVSHGEVRNAQKFYGRNDVKPDENKTFWSCVKDEYCSSFFYVFQAGANCLWFFLGGIVVTMIWGLLFLVTAMLKAHYSLKSWKRLRQMARCQTNIRTFRQGRFHEISSEDLIPGDIIEIQDGLQMQCEAMLVHGSVLMDEANLTGESIPMEKEAADIQDKKMIMGMTNPVTDNDNKFSINLGPVGQNEPLHLAKHKANMLFAGTSVIAVVNQYGLMEQDDSPNNKVSNELKKIAQVEEATTPGSGAGPDLDALDVNKKRKFFSERGAYAVVTHIGASTVRGDMIRTLFYPAASKFDFDSKLIKAYFLICVVQPITMFMMFKDVVLNPHAIERFMPTVFVSLTAFANLVNPIIPIVFTVSLNSSATRLEQKGVPCLETARISQAGKLKVFCFDKTGTLTKDGLDFTGICYVKSLEKGPNNWVSQKFEEIRRSIRDYTGGVLKLNSSKSTGGSVSSKNTNSGSSLSNTTSANTAVANDAERLTNMKRASSIINTNVNFRQKFAEIIYGRSAEDFNYQLKECNQEILLFGLACCHSLTLGGPQNPFEIVGNPLEKETLASIGWRMSRDDKTGNTIMIGEYDHEQSIVILRKWKFDQGRQLQAVIVEIKNERYVFIKGSLEATQEVCNRHLAKLTGMQTTESIMKLGDQYAFRGNYVLGMAVAQYQFPINGPSNGVAPEPGSVNLDTVLSDLKFEFLGMLLFRNELKPESIGMIRELREAEIEPIMITGDSLYTGITIAEQVGLVDKCTFIITLDASLGCPVWEEIDSSKIANKKRDSKSQDLDYLAKIVVEKNYNYVVRKKNVNRYSIAVHAAAFDVLRETEELSEIWSVIQPYVAIYGRAKPDGKIRIVRSYQEHSKRTVVGMCGDGGNDSGALKQANVGVALVHGSVEYSENNIVAPFVATYGDISKIPLILREGRSCLDSQIGAVYYSFICGLLWMAVGKIWIQSRMSWIQPAQFWVVDLNMAIFPILFSQQLPLDRLTRFSPDTNLVGPLSVTYVVSSFFISFAFFLILAECAELAMSKDFSIELKHPEDRYYPSWYAKTNIFREGIFNATEMSKRAHSFDGSIVYYSFLLFPINAAMSMSFGGRNIGKKPGDHSTQGSRSSTRQSKRKSFADSSKSNNSVKPIETVNTEKQPLLYSQDSPNSVTNNSDSIATPINSTQSKVSSSDKASGSIRVAGLDTNQGQNYDKSAAHPAFSPIDLSWFGHPYKKHTWMNKPLWMGFLLMLSVQIFCITFESTSINYIIGTNWVSQKDLPLKQYFDAWHGTGRTMRELTPDEILQIKWNIPDKGLFAPQFAMKPEDVSRYGQNQSQTNSGSSSESPVTGVKGGSSTTSIGSTGPASASGSAVSSSNSDSASKAKKEKPSTQAVYMSPNHCWNYIKEIIDKNSGDDIIDLDRTGALLPPLSDDAAEKGATQGADEEGNPVAYTTPKDVISGVSTLSDKNRDVNVNSNNLNGNTATAAAAVKELNSSQASAIVTANAEKNNIAAASGSNSGSAVQTGDTKTDLTKKAKAKKNPSDTSVNTLSKSRLAEDSETECAIRISAKKNPATDDPKLTPKVDSKGKPIDKSAAKSETSVTGTNAITAGSVVPVNTNSMKNELQTSSTAVSDTSTSTSPMSSASQSLVPSVGKAADRESKNFHKDEGIFSRLGLNPQSSSQSRIQNPIERQRWCSYLCMNSWEYRGSIQHFQSFGCKYSLVVAPLKSKTDDGLAANEGDWDCYLFQGNIDAFTGSRENGGKGQEVKLVNQPEDWNRLEILSRHNVFGKGKDGYTDSTYSYFCVIMTFVHLFVNILFTKWWYVPHH